MTNYFLYDFNQVFRTYINNNDKCSKILTNYHHSYCEVYSNNNGDV